MAQQAKVLGVGPEQFVGMVLDCIQTLQGAMGDSNPSERELAVRLDRAYRSLDFSPGPTTISESSRLSSQPAGLPTDNPNDYWAEAVERHAASGNTIWSPKPVDPEPPFDIVEWYVRSYRRLADAPPPDALHHLVSSLLERGELYEDWERFPPGTRPVPEDTTQWVAQVDRAIGNMPASLGDADAIICWLEANRLRMVGRLAEIRQGDSIARAIAFRDSHISRASLGLHMALVLVEQRWPQFHRDIAPTVRRYVADVRVRTETWLAHDSDSALFLRGVTERLEMEQDRYAPPSRLGRESTRWLEGHQYRFAKLAGTPGAPPAEHFEEVTAFHWERLRERLLQEYGRVPDGPTN